MKKIITLIAGICFVFGVAGNATAAFDYGMDSSLVLSITDKKYTEMGYDLGTLDVDINLTGPWESSLNELIFIRKTL